MTTLSPLLVAQITDTHLFADTDSEMLGVQTAQSFQAVLECLQQLQPRPDVLLLTGDLSQDETSLSYQRLASAIAPLGIPTYWLPGNHDRVPVMAQVLNQPPISAEKSFRLANWHFLLLSTAMPGCVHGELSSETLQWLEAQLQQSGDKAAIVALHHPPLAINSEWMDRISLRNPQDLFAVIDRYPQVKIVLCGHIHQPFQGERHGVFYLGTPSTCVQFLPENPTLIIDPIPPGFRLLSLYPNGAWDTKIERVII